jgi:homospermidine synthase
MSTDRCGFDGRLVMVGFGCIGQGVLPLLLRHVDLQPSQMLILTADESGLDVARAHGVAARVAPLNAANLQAMLDPLLGSGDFCLNLSVDVSSAALIARCQALGALYLDTCIEPWAGGYIDAGLPAAQRTN